jgi:hypothetical protein
MSCLVLNTGISQDCRKSLGGVKRFLVAQLDSITSITEASGVATSITKSGLFYEFKPTKDSSTASAPFNGDVAAGQRAWTHTVVMQFSKTEAAKRNTVAVLAENSVVVIAEDNNGTYSLYGWTRGLDLTEGDNTLGTTAAEMNGYTLTLSGDQAYLPLEVDSTIIAGLLT